MSKLNFHTLSIVNNLKTGEIGKRITTFKAVEKKQLNWVNYQPKENDMPGYKKRNERQADGSGIPDMPTLQYGKAKEDPIELVLNHFTNKFGGDSTKAKAELKKLDGASVLKLLDAIKLNEGETGIAYKKGDFEVYSMPKMT